MILLLLLITCSSNSVAISVILKGGDYILKPFSSLLLLSTEGSICSLGAHRPSVVTLNCLLGNGEVGQLITADKHVYQLTYLSDFILNVMFPKGQDMIQM